MLRILIIVCSVVSMFGSMLALSGCGMWRGSDEIETDVGGADGIGKGPGMVTGKRGGIVIFQK